MTIEMIESFEKFSALRSEWNELLQASPSDCVFLTHEWLATWWKHLAGGRQLSIVSVRDDGRLVGIAPLAVREPQYARMMPHALEFLGSGIIGSDYLDVMVRRGHEAEVQRAMAEHLTQMNVMLQLSQLRRGECAALELAKRLESSAWTFAEHKINVCPYIQLGGHTWESYLATLSSNQRYNFQRRLKNLSKNFDTRLEIASAPEQAQKFLDVLIALHKKRWETRGEDSEAFQTDAIVAFHREFIRLALEQGWLRLMTLYVNDAPAAALYGLRYGPAFYFYQSGFEPAYSKQSVGLVMMGLAIKCAVEESASEYDLLHGDEEYKFHWALRARELGRLEVYPPLTRGLIYRHAIDLNRAARRMARRVLTRT